MELSPDEKYNFFCAEAEVQEKEHSCLPTFDENEVLEKGSE